MASDTPALDRLVERMMQRLTRGIAGMDVPPEPLVRIEGAEEAAAFLRMADPERTSALINQIIRAMTSIDTPLGPIDLGAQDDQITLHRWESGLHDGATERLAEVLEDVCTGVAQEANSLFGTYLPEGAGAVFADLWRIASQPESFEEGSPYYKLSNSPNELLGALSFLVFEVALRLFMSRHGREVTLKWAEAAALISPDDEADGDAL
jgi:hypothetical protein